MLAVQPVSIQHDESMAAARSESASARKKTRTLLEKVTKEYERISRKRMNDDARSDELTALVLLRWASGSGGAVAFLQQPSNLSYWPRAGQC